MNLNFVDEVFNSDTEDEDRLLIVEETDKEEKQAKASPTVNNIDHSSSSVENDEVIETMNHNNNEVTVSTRVRSIHNDKKESLIWMHNTNLRQDLCKEIKKPGRSKFLEDEYNSLKIYSVKAGVRFTEVLNTFTCILTYRSHNTFTCILTYRSNNTFTCILTYRRVIFF